MLPYTRGYMLPAVVLKKEEGWQEEILKELKEVLHLLKGRENEYQMAGKLVWIWQIFIEHMKSEVVKPTRSYIRKQERIQAMLTYIHEHYMEEIRLREIAEAAAVSVGECCRCFQNMVRTTPNQYLTEYRIEKTSIHDGEGLRTVVFFKGCPLRCKWCSTPESQRMELEKGYGKDMTVEEVVKEICKDEIFFFHSGGGVTISGGEVLMQAEFARDILVSNERIKENLMKADREFAGDIHIRIPVIPTVNMFEENMEETAKFLRRLKHVKDVELLPYHRLGLETYERLGRIYELKDINPPDREALMEMAEIIRRNNLPVADSGD